MTWYPNNNGYQWNLDKRQVKKTPQLKQFQSWLVNQSNCGSITRQEAVSMIPPLFLDAKPNHVVCLLSYAIIIILM